MRVGGGGGEGSSERWSGRSGVDGGAGFGWGVREGERREKQLGGSASESGLVPEGFRPFCAD